MKVKKYIVVLCLLSFIFCPGQANTSMLSIGVRGGGQTYLPTAAVGATGDVQPGIGGAGAIDLRYTFFGCLNSSFGLGFSVGAGVGYGSAGFQGTNTDSYTNIDYLGNRMDYTIQSAFKQTDRFVKADASLLFAMCFGNFTVHVGPRFMMPFMASSAVTIPSATIDAFYPAYGVHVTDQLITGKLTTPYSQTVTPSLPEYEVLMAAELGYEWYVNDRNCLGLQAFVDVAVWSKPSTLNIQPSALISVAPISDSSNPIPTVTVHSPSYLVSDLRYIGFGIRAYYAFSIGPAYRDKHMPARDTRLHRNRYRWW